MVRKVDIAACYTFNTLRLQFPSCDVDNGFVATLQF